MNDRHKRWLERDPENREKAREATRLWKQRNRAQVNAHQAKRRYRLTEGGYTQHEWDQLVAEWNHRCAYCGAEGPLEADHIVPLSKRGPHDISNILPACPTCNREKHNKYVIEWLSGERW